jgi:hypothetical protein
MLVAVPMQEPAEVRGATFRLPDLGLGTGGVVGRSARCRARGSLSAACRRETGCASVLGVCEQGGQQFDELMFVGVSEAGHGVLFGLRRKLLCRSPAVVPGRGELDEYAGAM